MKLRLVVHLNNDQIIFYNSQKSIHFSMILRLEFHDILSMISFQYHQLCTMWISHSKQLQGNKINLSKCIEASARYFREQERALGQIIKWQVGTLPTLLADLTMSYHTERQVVWTNKKYYYKLVENDLIYAYNSTSNLCPSLVSLSPPLSHTHTFTNTWYIRNYS